MCNLTYTFTQLFYQPSLMAVTNSSWPRKTMDRISLETVEKFQPDWNRSNKNIQPTRVFFSLCIFLSSMFLCFEFCVHKWSTHCWAVKWNAVSRQCMHRWHGAGLNIAGPTKSPRKYITVSVRVDKSTRKNKWQVFTKLIVFKKPCFQL